MITEYEWISYGYLVEVESWVEDGVGIRVFWIRDGGVVLAREGEYQSMMDGINHNERR